MLGSHKIYWKKIVVNESMASEDVCVCLYVTSCPFPTTIESFPDGIQRGWSPWSDHGDGFQDPTVPTQRRDDIFTHKCSWVTTLGRITRELKSGRLRGIPNLICREERVPRPLLNLMNIEKRIPSAHGIR
jgi:hypothetical protein